MKIGRFISSFVMVLAAAIILLTNNGFAQNPSPEKCITNEGVDVDTNKPAVTKGLVINSEDLVQRACKLANSSVALIGFLPSDLFTFAREPKVTKAKYSTSLRELTISKREPQSHDEDSAALATQLHNPVSSLASVTLQNNLDYLMAADREGWRYTMNFEPVVPFHINQNWQLISRTTIPFIQQDGIVESTIQSGLGDTLQSLFLSPSRKEGMFWGVGATLVIPTATDPRLGSGKFGLGPTLVVGKQQRAWTFGTLARQIWSVAGHQDRADVRSTFIQPFVAYTTKSAWTIAINTESTYDWEGRQWSVPIHLEISRVIKVGRQAVSFGGVVRCWGAAFHGGPEACGLRFFATPLFPSK
jgi:hypothetical protein